MIEGETILCFAPEKWGHIWRNRHQIMSRLARRNQVLFVEPRPYLRDVLPLGARAQAGLGGSACAASDTDRGAWRSVGLSLAGVCADQRKVSA